LAANRYEEIKTSSEEFRNTAINYSSIVDSMKDMTKGTAEYNEALVKANDEAMKLINSNKELAGKYKIKNGLI
jgi:methylthioribose-1-phosphate isomerase